MIVFKLERERPAYSTSGGLLYYVKDRYLRTYDFATQRDNPLVIVRRGGASGTPLHKILPSQLTYWEGHPTTCCFPRLCTVTHVTFSNARPISKLLNFS